MKKIFKFILWIPIVIVLFFVLMIILEYFFPSYPFPDKGHKILSKDLSRGYGFYYIEHPETFYDELLALNYHVNVLNLEDMKDSDPYIETYNDYFNICDSYFIFIKNHSSDKSIRNYTRIIMSPQKTKSMIQYRYSL